MTNHAGKASNLGAAFAVAAFMTVGYGTLGLMVQGMAENLLKPQPVRHQINDWQRGLQTDTRLLGLIHASGPK